MSEAIAVRERWKMGIEARALVLLTGVLIAFGLATLFSASAMVAMHQGRASTYYFLRQAQGALIGIVLFMVAAKVDAEYWKRVAWPAVFAVGLMLLATLLMGRGVNGSRRFLFGGSLQPSELGKLALVIWTSMLIVKKGEMIRQLGKGLVPFLVVVGAMDLLVAAQPDISVALTYTVIVAALLYVAGARVKHFLAIGALSLPAAAIALYLMYTQTTKKYVVVRLLAFFRPDLATKDANFQGQEALTAVGSGGIFGRGFGQGRQQLGFIPEGITDFIAGTIGEEWGFIGMLLTILLFMLYTWLGIRIARQARSPFQRLVAFGLTLVTAITAYVHLGVVIGLLPNTGLTLPFISWGRTNLVLTFLMTGILVNIGSAKERVTPSIATNPLVR